MDKKKKKIIYNIALALLVMIAVGSGGSIIFRMRAQQKNDAALAALGNIVSDSSEDMAIQPGSDEKHGSSPEENGENVVTPEAALHFRKERLSGYMKLTEENPDVAGWVSIPDTKIDYPVMQTPAAPDYYLKHNFDREKSAYGVPYAAEDCDLGRSSNVIIYGHHMKNGSMFAALAGYTDEEFYKKHSWFWFDTLEETGLYQIIGVCTASAAGSDQLFGMARIQNEQEYDDYVREIKHRSFYDTGITATWGEPLVTLMTCEYTTREGRLFVVGKKHQNDGERETYESNGTEKVKE